MFPEVNNVHICFRAATFEEFLPKLIGIEHVELLPLPSSLDIASIWERSNAVASRENGILLRKKVLIANKESYSWCVYKVSPLIVAV